MSNRRYTRELLEDAVKESTSIAGVLRYLGLRQAGGTQALMGKRIREYEIDISHFTGQAHNRGKSSTNKRPWQKILVLGKETDGRTKRPQLKRAMLEYGFVYTCDIDSQEPMWNNEPLTLDIDHINGHFWDNRPENVRFLCPNCHTQQVDTNMPGKYRTE